MNKGTLQKAMDTSKLAVLSRRNRILQAQVTAITQERDAALAFIEVFEDE